MRVSERVPLTADLAPRLTPLFLPSITYANILYVFRFKELRVFHCLSNYIQKNSSNLSIYIYIRLSQTIVLSSQTNKIKLGTTFSHSFGQKNYRKLKIEKFCPFFKPAQAVQNFTIKHTYLKKGQLENLIFFKISTVKK